ncbi:MAG: putative glycosyltransferase EpsH [Pseudomonadota bacterium]|jgi:glycosyltransferase involved in cell wall biosynthesis
MDVKLQQFIRSTPWALAGTREEHIERTIANEAGRFAGVDLGKSPLVSLIVPLFNTPPRLLDELILSIRAQTWPHWELILVDDGSLQTAHLGIADAAAAADSRRIKVIRSARQGGISAARNAGIAAATGAWVGFADHDDLLHPQALGVFARWIAERPQLNFVYSNEVKLAEDSSQLGDFLYKPDFCPSTLLRLNYIAHLTLVRRDLIDALRRPDGQWFRSEYDGVEDHEFFLRASGAAGFCAGHIPLFLYSWRRIAGSTADTLEAKPYVHERGLKMVREYLAARNLEPLDLAPEISRDGNRALRVKFVDPKAAAAARILVVIPFKDGWELTRACLDSLEGQTTRAAAVTCVLVDNNSQDPSTRQRLSAWMATAGRRFNYQVMDFPGAFNFARMNNQAVEKYAGESTTHVLFLNNDVELRDPTTLDVMVSNLAYDAGLAFCGIRLDYPGAAGLVSGGIQHGGIKFGLEMRGGPLFRTTHMHSAGEYAMDDHVVTAVTFAAAMCRKAVFEELEGLEENWLPNGLGDVDICLRAARAGYRSFYLGSVTGIHHESKTRKDFCEDLEQVILYERHAALIQPMMMRQLGYDTFAGLQQGAAWFAKPLRYRIADRVNAALKGILGPFHRQFRNLWKQWESNQKQQRKSTRPA